MKFLAKYERYCELVHEFLGHDYLTVEFSRFTNDVIHDYMFELKKVLYEFTSDEMYELFKRYSFTSIKTLGSYSNAYKKFISFARTKNDVNVKNNIMLEKKMSPKELFRKSSNVYYYSEDEITAICNKIYMNRYYYETIIRIIYENVAPSIESTVRITLSDVDLANRKIIVNGSERLISNKLATAINKLLKLDNFETTNRKIPLDRRFNTLIPIVRYKSIDGVDEDTYYKRLSHNTSRAVTRIEDLNGNTLSITAVYNSGIVNCIRENFNNDDLFDLFTDDDIRKGSLRKREMSGEITDFLMKKGYSKRTAQFGDVKYCYQAYLRKKAALSTRPEQ